MDYFTSSETERRSKKNGKKIKKLLKQEYRNHMSDPFFNDPWPWYAVEATEMPWPWYAIEATEMPVNVIEARRPVNVIETTRRPVNVIEATRMPVNVIEATRMPVNVIEATRMPVNVIEATRMPGNSEFCECNHTASPYASTLRVDQPWIREAQQQLRNRDESPEWKQYSQNIRDRQDKLQHDRLVQAENEAWELIEQGHRRPLYFEPSPISDFVREAQEQLKRRDNLDYEKRK